MNYQLKIIFGKEEVDKFHNCGTFTADEIVSNVKDFYFKTEAEMKAFIDGMETVIGWTEYSIINEGKNIS